MAFADLLRALTQRTESEIDTLLGSARDQAAALQRDADRRCAERSGVALREHARAVDTETDRAVADAVREARRHELAARARARDRVFVAARERLRSAGRGASYGNTVPDRFAAAAAVMGDEPADVRCAPHLRDILVRLAQDNDNLRVVADPSLPGGFAIRSRDGRIEVDEVLEHRLSADAEYLGPVALRALVGPP